MASYQALLKILMAIGLGLGTESIHASAQAAPKLVQRDYLVCGQKRKLEVAQSVAEHAQGLMHRSGLEAGRGMLFLFAKEQALTFWMKDVSFDIDIGFFDTQGKFINSWTMAGTSPLIEEDALPRYASAKPARYAVEVEKGFFNRYGSKTCVLKALDKHP